LRLRRVNPFLVRPLLALALIVASSIFALVGCGGEQTTATTAASSTPAPIARSNAQIGPARPTKERRDQGRHRRLPPGVKLCRQGGQAQTIPAQIERQELRGDITTAVLFTVNAWITADCHGKTIVYAGSAGWKRSMGLVLIARFGHRSAKLGGGFLAVPASGSLRITRAPLGPHVVTSAQRHGDIQFTSDRGITGVIHLRSDTATLSTGDVVQAVPDVRSIGRG
jgi:hypothetical protein